MNRLHVFCAALLALLLAPMVAGAQSLNISVAASMTDATNDLIAQFKADGHSIEVLPNYGPSGALAKQINEGAPAQLFISANQKWMDFLRDEKNIDRPPNASWCATPWCSSVKRTPPSPKWKISPS